MSDEIRQETGGRFVRVLAPQLARSLAASRSSRRLPARGVRPLALHELATGWRWSPSTPGGRPDRPRAGPGREGDPVTPRAADSRRARAEARRRPPGRRRRPPVANDGELGGLRQPRGRCGHRDPRRRLSQPTEQARPATVASCEERSDGQRDAAASTRRQDDRREPGDVARVVEAAVMAAREGDAFPRQGALHPHRLHAASRAYSCLRLTCPRSRRQRQPVTPAVATELLEVVGAPRGEMNGSPPIQATKRGSTSGNVGAPSTSC